MQVKRDILFLPKMDNQQYGKLFSFIWNIANDVLVHAFEKGDYKKIILPFTVLRRIDVLLEATKPQVAAKKANDWLMKEILG